MFELQHRSALHSHVPDRPLTPSKTPEPRIAYRQSPGFAVSVPISASYGGTKSVALNEEAFFGEVSVVVE